jgi:hypothetical protein
VSVRTGAGSGVSARSVECNVSALGPNPGPGLTRGVTELAPVDVCGNDGSRRLLAIIQASWVSDARLVPFRKSCEVSLERCERISILDGSDTSLAPTAHLISSKISVKGTTKTSPKESSATTCP